MQIGHCIAVIVSVCALHTVLYVQMLNVINAYLPHRGLDMSKYMAEGALKDTSQSSHPPVYDLYATVNHFGSVFFGHYMAYIRPHENEGEL